MKPLSIHSLAVSLFLLSFIPTTGWAQNKAPLNPIKVSKKTTVTTEQSRVIEAQKHWIHTMEASMQAFPKPEVEIHIGSKIITWLGWMLALVFFMFLLSLHLKMKRHERFLLRGGDRDFFVLPPAYNRRRSPR